MATKVDLLVVGSGFGGLTAAALAAHSGLDVLLLERHTRPGGCAGDFALGGFWFPAGATVVTGLEPGGILRRVFDTIEAKVDSTALDPSVVFHVSGREFRYSASLPEWLDQLSAVGLLTTNYERFWRWSHETGGAVYRIGAALPSFPIERWADLRRSIPAFSPAAVKTLPLLVRTVGGVQRSFGAVGEPVQDGMIDSLLMDATGAPASECSAVQGGIALDLYRRGCQWVEGGTGALAMKLVRAIRADRGTVKFGSQVASLRRIHGGWEAQTTAGETIVANRVVANLPPAALDRLLGRTVRLSKPGTAWGAFVTHLGLDATGLEEVHPFHQVVAEGGNRFVSVYPARTQGPPRWSISVSKHVDPASWRGYASRVACNRHSEEQAAVEAVAQVIPGVRERIRLLRSATPATFERYTARPGGFVGGLVQRPETVAFRAPGHRPEPNLFLAGDHVFPGQGTVGTALSGINAYRDVIESLGKKALL